MVVDDYFVAIMPSKSELKKCVDDFRILWSDMEKRFIARRQTNRSLDRKKPIKKDSFVPEQNRFFVCVSEKVMGDGR